MKSGVSAERLMQRLVGGGVEFAKARALLSHFKLSVSRAEQNFLGCRLRAVLTRNGDGRRKAFRSE